MMFSSFPNVGMNFYSSLENARKCHWDSVAHFCRTRGAGKIIPGTCCLLCTIFFLVGLRGQNEHHRVRAIQSFRVLSCPIRALCVIIRLVSRRRKKSLRGICKGRVLNAFDKIHHARILRVADRLRTGQAHKGELEPLPPWREAPERSRLCIAIHCHYIQTIAITFYVYRLFLSMLESVRNCV